MSFNSASKPVDVDALTRIPLPAVLADHGYGIQQTGPGRFQAESPDHSERLSVSCLPDGKWLYRDQNHPANKGNAINFLQAHGVNGFREAANALASYTQPEKSAAATALLNDLEHRHQDAGRDELRRFNAEIPLNRFVEAHGWTLDARESTRDWEKYRGPAGDSIVISPDRNLYFHQRDKDQDKGGVIQFTRAHVLNKGSLGEARKYLRDFSGDKSPEWKMQAQAHAARAGQRGADVVDLPRIEDRKAEWKDLVPLSPKSAHYLTAIRGLEPETLAAYGRSIRTDIHRTEKGGELHNVAFAHVAIDKDNRAVIAGWEKKGPGKEKTFNGVHGHRGIAVFKHKDFANADERGPDDAGFCQKVVLCESSIDALSKAQMDGRHPGDIYVSIGGTPSAAAEKSLSALIRKNEPREVVLAFDNDDAGRGFAIRMERYLASENQKFHMPMIHTRMEFPPKGFKDYNDMVKPRVPVQDRTRQGRAREAGIGMGD
ncbi:toprim domain-containing protein [Acidithiobacillus ferrooxidans]|uniref:toprim domain-containing protein n=1 Tax=Acidithiobacillus ferrooxidans TaxID=920 RepID=UPI000A7AE149